MPFRLAPLDTETEYSPLVNWLVNGAVLPSAEVIENSRKTKSPEVVTQWEDFFNNPTNKGKWTARYLYEHLFETHFYIDEAPGEFFEIVRSKTKSPEKIVAISSDHETESPFERAYEMMNAEPKVFYYRLRKIHSTIVFKNHIIYHVNNNKLDHLKKQFWQSNWGNDVEKYELNFTHSNPFVAFKGIPAKIRYTWMLENAEMLMKLIMSGPNCRINNAGSMIWDNYLAIFLKPEADATVQFDDYFEKVAQDLPIPRFTGAVNRYLSQYKKEQTDYAKTKVHYQTILRPDGLSYDDIWTGNGLDKNSLISIFRHIDYASAFAGHFVDTPRSVHLFDYVTFERLYYLCVLATTIRDSAISQVPVVRYLFDLKKELDEQFLSLIPEHLRDKFRDELVEANGKKYDYNVNFALPYNKENKYIANSASFKENVAIILKKTFPERILGEKSPLSQSQRDSDLVKLEELHKVTGGRASHFPEITIIKIQNATDGTTKYFTLLVNRYHSFLNRILTDKKSWDPTRDQFQVLSGIQVDFPYKMFIVSSENVDQLISDVNAVDTREKYLLFDKKYALQKKDADFWKEIDAIHTYFHRMNPIGAGILDLHKYGKNDLAAPSYSE